MVPVLLAVVAGDANVDHFVVLRLQVPSHEAAAPNRLAALAERVGLRLVVLHRQPLLLIINDTMTPRRMITQRLECARRD
eukprot:2589799-Prymnesium_polylepis.2